MIRLFKTRRKVKNALDLSVIQSSHVQHEKNCLESWLRFEERGRLAAMSFSDRLRRFYETICKRELAGMKFRVGWNKKWRRFVLNFWWDRTKLCRFYLVVYLIIAQTPFSHFLTRHEKFFFICQALLSPRQDTSILPLVLQLFKCRHLHSLHSFSKLNFKLLHILESIWKGVKSFTDSWIDLSQLNFAIYKLPPDFSSISDRKASNK